MALYKRILPSGEIKWYAGYRDLNGAWKRESLGTSNKKHAEKIYKQKMENLTLKKAGYKNDDEEKIKAPLLEGFKEEIFEHLVMIQRAPKTVEAYRNAFKSFASIGNKTISGITSREIERWKQASLETKADSTVSIYMRSLKAAFNISKKWGYIKQNPFADVEMVRTTSDKEAPMIFSKEQLKKLFKVIDQDKRGWSRNEQEKKFWSNLFKFYLITGMRRNELIYLEWGDVDFKKRGIHIRNKDNFQTKTRYERKLPITEEMEKILKEVGPHQKEGYVFKAKRAGGLLNEDYVGRRFKKYLRSAGIDPALHLHNLRHTFATTLVEKRAPIVAVSKLLGHTSLRTTQRYEHTTAEQYRKEAELINLDTLLNS